MALPAHISSIVKYISTYGAPLAFIRMLIRPSLALDWAAEERFNAPTYEKGWGYEQRGHSICVGIRNSGLMQTASNCNVYIEQIKKGERVVFRGRKRLAWADGGYEPRDIRHGKYRGTMARIGQSDNRHSQFLLAWKNSGSIINERADYSVLIVADAPSIWVSRAELTVVIRHYPFSPDTHVMEARRRPWYKKLW